MIVRIVSGDPVHLTQLLESWLGQPLGYTSSASRITLPSSAGLTRRNEIPTRAM